MRDGKGQISYLIEAAQDTVAQKGMEASDREIMLACFGFLAGKLGTLPCLADCPVETKSRKGLIAVLSMLAAAVLAAAGAVYQVFRK